MANIRATICSIVESSSFGSDHQLLGRPAQSMQDRSTAVLTWSSRSNGDTYTCRALCSSTKVSGVPNSVNDVHVYLQNARFANVSSRYHEAVAEFITRANFAAVAGHFELNTGNGDFAYHAQLGWTAPATLDMMRSPMEQMLHNAFQEADKFYAGIDKIQNHGSSASDAFGACRGSGNLQNLEAVAGLMLLRAMLQQLQT